MAKKGWAPCIWFRVTDPDPPLSVSLDELIFTTELGTRLGSKGGGGTQGCETNGKRQKSVPNHSCIENKTDSFIIIVRYMKSLPLFLISVYLQWIKSCFVLPLYWKL